MPVIIKRVGAKKRPGRPPQGPIVDKRKALSTRITAGLRGRLERAAEDNGRSLSQEIELRLERTFSGDDAEREKFGGRGPYLYMLALAAVANSLSAVRGKAWLRDTQTYDVARHVWSGLMDQLGPTGEGTAASMTARAISEEELWRACEEVGREIPERLREKGIELEDLGG